MSKANKYLYLFVVQGNYGYGDGWEDLTAAERGKEAIDDLVAYRTNAPEYGYRLIQRRELNPDYKAG